MLSATVNAAESAQICPKSAQICQRQLGWKTLKCNQKLRFLCFSKIKKIMCRRSSRIYVHRLDFQYNNFYMSFLLSKNGLLYVNFSITPCKNDFFLNVPNLSWVWDFGNMYLTHLETRTWRGTFHIYFKKWFFWPSKLCCPLTAQGKKTF
jgi:hypothetical protein